MQQKHHRRMHGNKSMQEAATIVRPRTATVHFLMPLEGCTRVAQAMQEQGVLTGRRRKWVSWLALVVLLGLLLVLG